MIKNKPLFFTLLLLNVLFFSPSAFSQCDNLIEPSQSCDFLFTLHNEVLENDFCGRLPQSNVLPALIPFCNGISTSDNTGMFVIEPLTAELALRITPEDCSDISIPGQGTFSGLQAAIFKDCDFDELMVCVPTCNNSPFVLTSDKFVPFTEYILVFDGCSGSICDFKIEVISGQISELVPLVDPMLITPAVVCENEFPIIQIEGLPLATEGVWSVNGESDFEVLFNGKAIDIKDWNTPGMKEICATVKDPQTSEMLFDSCWTIEVKAAPELLSVIPDSLLCANDEIDLFFDGAGYDQISWEGSGLSCTNCPAPIFTMGTDTMEVSLSLENDLGCTASKTITFFPSTDPLCLTGTEDIASTVAIKIGPNPFYHNLNIQAREELSLSIFDINGRLIYQNDQVLDQVIPTANWSMGVYYAKVKRSNGERVFKLLKMAH